MAEEEERVVKVSLADFHAARERARNRLAYARREFDELSVQATRARCSR